MVQLFKLLLYVCLVHLGSSCPDYWTPYEGFCYDLIQNPSNWAGAAQICHQFNAFLVSVDSHEENEFLASFIESQNVTVLSVWLGANDLTRKGLWTWENGESLSYTNWYPGEPNNVQHSENCVGIYPSRNFQWNDNHCSVKTYFICETVDETSPIG